MFKRNSRELIINVLFLISYSAISLTGDYSYGLHVAHPINSLIGKLERGLNMLHGFVLIELISLRDPWL